MILFSGLLYQRGTAPAYLAWIEKISIVNYTFSAMLIQQVTHLTCFAHRRHLSLPPSLPPTVPPASHLLVSLCRVSPAEPHPAQRCGGGPAGLPADQAQRAKPRRKHAAGALCRLPRGTVRCPYGTDPAHVRGRLSPQAVALQASLGHVREGRSGRLRTRCQPRICKHMMGSS